MELTKFLDFDSEHLSLAFVCSFGTDLGFVPWICICDLGYAIYGIVLDKKFVMWTSSLILQPSTCDLNFGLCDGSKPLPFHL